MALELEKKNNYLVITDTDKDTCNTHPLCEVKIDKGASEGFYDIYVDGNKCYNDFPFTDITSSTLFTSEEEFCEWYTECTGCISGGSDLTLLEQKICDIVDNGISINNEITVNPNAAFSALFTNLGNQIAGEIQAQTVLITQSIQDVCDKLDAGITVNSVQSGTWTVNADLSTGDLQELANEISTALDGLNVTATIDNPSIDVNLLGEPIDVNVTNGDLSVSLSPGTLSDLESIDLNVDINNQPINVTGTVTVNQPVTVTFDNTALANAIASALDGLDVNVDNFGDLITLLTDPATTITVDGEVSLDAATITALTSPIVSELQTIEDAINNQVRNDWEYTGLCVFDSNGDEVLPTVRQYKERSYSNTGSLISETVVLSQHQENGSITAYSLNPGEVVKECKRVTCIGQTYYEVTGANGANEKLWNDGAGAVNGFSSSDPYTVSFSLTDLEGYPMHQNTEDVAQVINGATTTNVFGQDQAQLDFYLMMPFDADLIENVGTAETGSIWISENCGNEMTEKWVFPYANFNSNSLGVLPQGIYRVRFYVQDFSANGSLRLRYVDPVSGVIRDIPDEWIFQNRPVINEIKGWRCENGVNYNSDKTQVIDITEDNIFCDKFNKDAIQPSGNNIQEEPVSNTGLTQAEVVEAIRIAAVPTNAGITRFIGTTPVGIAATGPGWITAIDDNGAGNVRMTLDGTAPSTTNGIELSGDGANIGSKIFVPELAGVRVVTTSAAGEGFITWHQGGI